MAEQDALSISSTASRSHPDDIAQRSFPITRRGFDTTAVRQFLEEVARHVRDVRSSKGELTRQLAEAERRAASPELDEATLSAAVGSETARVLHAAHDAAREVLQRAESRAAALETEVQSRIDERRLAAEADARAMDEHARRDADVLLEEARSQCRRMVDEAREARRRIVADLGERRRTLHLQLEQLRVGKDSLSTIVSEAADAVEEVRRRLDVSEAEVQLAADGASPTVGLDLGDQELEDLIASSLVEVASSEATPNAEIEPKALDEPEFKPAEIVTQPSGDDIDSESKTPSDAGHVVEDLFARIRASRQEGVAQAHALLDDRAVVEPDEGREEIDLAEASSIDAASALDSSVDSSGETETADRQEVVGGSERTSTLIRRDELVLVALDDLGRSLKRALRSEQNDLLDAIRQLGRNEELAAHLPSEQTAARLALAAKAFLADAWRAGAKFAEERLPEVGGTDASEEKSADRTADELASLLATEIVASLSRRIGEAVADDPDGAEGAAAIGVAFREWKGTRVEGVAGDFATQAFSLGTVAIATQCGATLEWEVDDGATGCPDCDDNALAGPQAAGERFPTGHFHSPVHPGCRCVLVPRQS